MVKKIVAMSFCAAAFVGAMTAPALGGEVTGNGKPANGAANGNSPCAFSGQQDDLAIEPRRRLADPAGELHEAKLPQIGGWPETTCVERIPQ